VPRTKLKILEEHLPYELDMLERAFVILHLEKFTELRKDAFLRNAVIEAFWTHARNLVEFLMHPPNADADGTVSARDFTKDYLPDMKMKSIDQQINAQVSHLTYERKSLPSEKLNSGLSPPVQILKDLHRSGGAELQRLSLCKCHERNGGRMLIGYVRVSTDGQSPELRMLERQRGCGCSPHPERHREL
jgi:hypothetical protein